MFLSRIPSFFSKLPSFAFATINLKDIKIPKELLTTQFCRSSGPGGQNVNKVNTKAEVRFNVDLATWMDADVKKKFKDLNKNHINKDGEFSVKSQKTRTQEHNLSDAMEKLRYKVWEASLTEKERAFLIPSETESMKVRRVQVKRQKSETKQLRSGNYRDL